MKTIRSFILLLSLVIIPTTQSKAAVAVITAFSNPAAAGQIAINGLAITGAGTISTMIWPADNCDKGSCFMGLVAGITLGLVFLEVNGDIQFSEVDPLIGKELGLSASEINIYNMELDEVNLLTQEVLSGIKSYMTSQDAANLWLELKEFVSPETFAVMQSLSQR